MWEAIVSFFDGLTARYRARRAAQAQADLAKGQAIIDAAAAEQREMDGAARAVTTVGAAAAPLPPSPAESASAAPFVPPVGPTSVPVTPPSDHTPQVAAVRPEGVAPHPGTDAKASGVATTGRSR